MNILNRSLAVLSFFILTFSLTVNGEIKINTSTCETTLSTNDSLKISILYDNYIFAEGTKPDWGFACLIEGTEKTILFDTGTKNDILIHNISQMNVDVSTIDQVVISHHHRDHFGGLQAVLEKKSHLTVYLPQSFPKSFQKQVKGKKAKLVTVNDPLEICKNVYLTGEMGDEIKEQSLILDTSKGLIIVTGCSHPGISKIVKKSKEIIDRDVYLVFGGFHLLRHSKNEVQKIIKQFNELGVQKCGATHCTGDVQINLFKQTFGKNYVKLGTGKVIKVAK